jgi:hypothetical protein
MKVALKYCGGCDPAYERVEYFQRIKQAAGKSIQWVRPDEGGYSALLLICGCDKACPLEEMPRTDNLVLIKHDQAAPEAVAARLKEKEVAHGH